MYPKQAFCIQGLGQNKIEMISFQLIAYAILFIQPPSHFTHRHDTNLKLWEKELYLRNGDTVSRTISIPQ